MSDFEQTELPQFLSEAYRSLDRRDRPEDVARLILDRLDLDRSEFSILERAARGAENWSSMSRDFARASTMASQLQVARALFKADASFDPSDTDSIQEYLVRAEQEIGKGYGENNFLTDRKNREQRKEIGLDLSKRQYNKRFRLAKRMERKRKRMIREQLKRSLTLASKSRLACHLRAEHLRDANTAAFIVYYVSRCNLRNIFTNGSQVRPYDKICDLLMTRCKQSSTTNWFAIAHTLPDEDVLSHLSEKMKGELLGRYFRMLHRAAGLLSDVWSKNQIDRETMVVRRGNDSTTWNVTAGAWNKLRSGWFSLLFSMGLQDWVERICPGKVLRLMAADVAAWHRMSGNELHVDTGPWCDLPLPWEVLKGAPCPQSLVSRVCDKWGVDPVKHGWIAPPPPRAVAEFTPTPELVHGVEVGDPQLATLLRKIGVFSGKSLKIGPALG